jgi:phosphohistidine phosphatase
MPKLELYLVRHGIAAEHVEGQSDDLRPLTADGVARLGAAAAGLLALKVRWDLIMSSPLLRARQTADVLARCMKTEAPVIVCAALAPSGSFADVVASLANEKAHSAIALVGHEPGMGALAARLLGTAAPLVFKKGAVCRLDFSVSSAGGVGTLRWFATSKMLRLMGAKQNVKQADD